MDEIVRWFDFIPTDLMTVFIAVGIFFLVMFTVYNIIEDDRKNGDPYDF